MEHTKALLYKFILILASLLVVFGFIYGVSFGDILLMSIILTIVLYILGDLVILPRFGNLTATLGDFGISYLGLWFLGNMYVEEDIRLSVASFLSACLITIGEAFFHMYLDRNVFGDDNEEQNNDSKALNVGAFQSEMAEESYPDIPDDFAVEKHPSGSASLEPNISYERYPNDNSDEEVNVANNTPLAKVTQFNTGLANNSDPEEAITPGRNKHSVNKEEQ